jgi:5'-nucleotidase
VLNEQDWRRATEWTRPLLRDLANRTRIPGAFWNINLPSLEPGVHDTQIVFCPLDPSPLPLSFNEDRDFVHYNGKYANRPRRSGSDVDVCFGGKIAVTEVTAMEPSR